MASVWHYHHYCAVEIQCQPVHASHMTHASRALPSTIDCVPFSPTVRPTSKQDAARNAECDRRGGEFSALRLSMSREVEKRDLGTVCQARFATVREKKVSCGCELLLILARTHIFSLEKKSVSFKLAIQFRESSINLGLVCGF